MLNLKEYDYDNQGNIYHLGAKLEPQINNNGYKQFYIQSKYITNHHLMFKISNIDTTGFIINRNNGNILDNSVWNLIPMRRGTSIHYHSNRRAKAKKLYAKLNPNEPRLKKSGEWLNNWLNEYEQPAIKTIFNSLETMQHKHLSILDMYLEYYPQPHNQKTLTDSNNLLKMILKIKS